MISSGDGDMSWDLLAAKEYHLALHGNGHALRVLNVGRYR